MPTLPSHQPTTERFIHLAPPRLLQCDYNGTTTEDGFKMTRLDHSAIPALQPDYRHRNFTIFTRLRPAPRVFFSVLLYAQKQRRTLPFPALSWQRSPEHLGPTC
ncbi:hypothetical protein SMMN14_05871, partial [Sphaerulina musiva]